MNRKPEIRNQKSLNRLKIFAVFLTVGGVALFAYFIYSVGFGNILAGIGRLGFDGFALIIFLYFLRMLTRAAAWKLSVGKPYNLGLRDAVSAVIIGEALSSLIPLGILISGTSKAVAVRSRVPLVVGLSSVATENLFYSLMTGIFIVVGGIAFLQQFELEQGWMLAIDVLLGLTTALIVLGILAIVRQWRFASAICEKLYRKGIAVNLLENGRAEVRRFENFIYGFYREYPNRFAPILFFQFVFHSDRHRRNLVCFESFERFGCAFLHGVYARINQPDNFNRFQTRAVRHRRGRSRSAVRHRNAWFRRGNRRDNRRDPQSANHFLDGNRLDNNFQARHLAQRNHELSRRVGTVCGSGWLNIIDAHHQVKLTLAKH